jgi:hypothetical protein
MSSPTAINSSLDCCATAFDNNMPDRLLAICNLWGIEMKEQMA